MAPPKKAVKSTHSLARMPAGAPRRRYLAATVTQKEKDAILEYCNKHNMSVSAFLADLALKDAQRSGKRSAEEQITLTLRLPAHHVDKMLIFARLEDKTLADLLRKLLEPSFQKRQTTTALKLHTIRCWLSNEEHRVIKRHLARHRLSARSYLALLALKAIENS